MLGLLLLPLSFTVPLLLRKSLIFLLHRLQLSLFAHGVLVLEHASHAGAGSSLLSIVSFLLHVGGVLFLVLVYLLVAPVALLRSLVLDALGVEEVFSLKLAASRGEGRHILFGAVKALSRSLHILNFI